MIPLGPRGYAEAGSSQISRAIRRVVAAGPGRRSSSDPRDHARKVGFFFAIAVSFAAGLESQACFRCERQQATVVVGARLRTHGGSWLGGLVR
jgi:hypothetical protein